MSGPSHGPEHPQGPGPGSTAGRWRLVVGGGDERLHAFARRPELTTKVPSRVFSVGLKGNASFLSVT